jgi:hypothetical protein
LRLSSFINKALLKSLVLVGLLSALAWSQISPRERELKQEMLWHVTSDVREHYYDPKLHGIDWSAKVRFFPDLHVLGQSPSPSVSLPDLAPEIGLLSPSKYTNAFFGFSISLPQNADLREKTLSLNRGTQDHLLIGFHSPSKDLISFTITAREVSGESESEARKSAAGPNSSTPKETKIGGRTFWRSKTGGRKMQTLIFATAMDKYVLQFEVTSFNPEITTEIERNIEQLTFFDPSRAKVMAGTDSKPYTPGASQFPASGIARLSAGSVSGNVYRNQELGFRYEFPQGWVLMSKATEEGVPEAGQQFVWGNSTTAQQEHEAADQCARNLLLVTRHLEGSENGRFNSRALLIVADPKCAPGSSFPKAVDDREALQQIARQIVQSFRIAPKSTPGPARVRAFNNAGRIMVEVSQSFTVDAPGQSDPATILSSTSLVQAGDYWVIWMFAAGDKGELEELRNSKIFFDDPVGPTTDPKTQ